MDKIIEKLYNSHLQEEQFPFGIAEKESMQKEYELYCMLTQTMPQPMREQFREYVTLNEERHQSELKTIYEQGFKMAIKLILEGIKE
jgi:hypothetical protein